MIDSVDIVLFIIGCFFAINMGGSGIAPSFSTALGSKIVSLQHSIFLFFIFSCIGAVFFGGSVAKTLGTSVIPKEAMNPKIVIIIMGASSVSMFLANMLKIPESTSWVVLTSLSVVGIYYSKFNYQTVFFQMLPAWLILPIIAFLCVYFVLGKVYPLREKNLWIYEKLLKHETKMRRFVLLSSCCVAMAIGSNNVGNVVGPLSSAGLFSVSLGLILMAPFFGSGGFIFSSSAHSLGNKIVPLGPFTASLVKLIFGTLLIIASLLGIPQSSVQLSFACILAVSARKDGLSVLFSNRIIQKIILMWFVSPLLSGSLTWGMLSLLSL